MDRARGPDGPVVRAIGPGGFRVDENVYPALLLTPTRAEGWAPPPLDARGMGVEAMDSRAAARAWGVLRAEGRPIVAALYPLA